MCELRIEIRTDTTSSTAAEAVFCDSQCAVLLVKTFIQNEHFILGMLGLSHYALKMMGEPQALTSNLAHMHHWKLQ